MDYGHDGVSIELQKTEEHPLLMDTDHIHSHRDQVSIAIPSEDPEEQYTDHAGQSLSSASTGASSSAHFLNQLQLSASSEPVPVEAHSNSGRQDGHQTRRHLCSQLWSLIEMSLTVIQIVASIIVLCISRNERPKAPLSLWVVGYMSGCLISLTLWYWRYKSQLVQQAESEHIASRVASVSSGPSLRNRPLTVVHDAHVQGEVQEDGGPGDPVHSGEPSRCDIYVGRFKIMLECFFAVWFVVGNIWIFGGHSSYRDAPNLYRLCIAFLMFSCIGYAMPFIICAMVCCCLPCIITILGYRDDQGKVKGATAEVIKALPVYKFKTRYCQYRTPKDTNDSDGESLGEEGVFAPGTNEERLVSGEDAVCCICLGKYKNGVDLKALPCSHFFHVECVDKWLKINGSCPLCKHELTKSVDISEPVAAEEGA